MLGRCRVRASFRKIWKGMEIENGIFYDLENFRKDIILQKAIENFNFCRKILKISRNGCSFVSYYIPSILLSIMRSIIYKQAIKYIVESIVYLLL